MNYGIEIKKWIRNMLDFGFLEECADRDVLYYTKHRPVAKKGSKTVRIVGMFNRLNECMKTKILVAALVN